MVCRSPAGQPGPTLPCQLLTRFSWSAPWSHVLCPAAQMLLEQKLSTAPYGTLRDSRTFWAGCMEIFVNTCQHKLTNKSWEALKCHSSEKFHPVNFSWYHPAMK